MGQFDDHAEASWRGSGSPASISRPTQYRSTPAPSVQSTSNDTSAAEKVAAKKTSSPSHGLPIQLAADNSAAERKKSSFTGNTAEAGSKDRRPEADVVRIIPVVVESVPQRQPRRPSSDRPMSATTSERRYDSNDGGKRDGARNRQSPIVPQSGGFAEVRQVAPVTQGARSVPIPVTRASWSSVTSTDEFIFAPTTPVADSARVQSPLSPGARDERPKLQTSTSTTTVTRSSMFAPTSVNSHHVQQQQPSGGSASTDRSWESCAMPVGPRATTTVRPRPSTVPSSGDEPGRRVTVTTKDESKTPVKRLGNLDVNESTDTATNVVLTPPQSPGALIPVPVKHETTIPVRNAVRTNAAATIVPVQTVGSNRRESTNESTLTHTMSVMTGGSTAGNGDNVTTTRKTTTITKTHGGISSCSSSDEAMTATDGPRGSFDRTAELDEFGHGAAETFELVVVKSGLGLSFCIEGGKDSSYGDRPITVKRVFRGGRIYSIGLAGRFVAGAMHL